MANVCSCYMKVTGDTKSKKELLDLILKQDPSLDNLFTWFLKGSYYGLECDPEEFTTKKESYLSIVFTCKWSPPENKILELSEAYPLLTFETRYEESGMTLYGIITYLNGDKIEDSPMEEEAYLMKFDENFKDVVTSIKNDARKNYKKFLKEALDNMKALEEENSNWVSLLEKICLSCIKTEDLPLFINYKWSHSRNKETFLKRLKGE
jgi:hypothetical protein